jgi:hypothetical protein
MGFNSAFKGLNSSVELSSSLKANSFSPIQEFPACGTGSIITALQSNKAILLNVSQINPIDSLPGFI